ncbi:uncharacterized protein ARMOST_20005 [Armillaria ostoyae]|uniref:SAP domain-containing protein n=1 Tax=Armillaria ostoyae TaxID=47428 RepID=A0A284S645_ARMOS|nr:uncharacterized protein ARMOST_20005 [Armillaria ostoyae]
MQQPAPSVARAQELPPPPSHQTLSTLPQWPPAPMYGFPCRDEDLENKDSDFEIEYLDLTLELHLLPWFREQCKHFNLPYSGTKAALCEQLITFSSSGMDHWKSSLMFPARQAHKGVRGGGIVKSSKKPMYRCQCLLQANSVSGPSSQAMFPVERSKDTRTQQDRDKMDDWLTTLEAKIVVMPPQDLWHSHLVDRGVNENDRGQPMAHEVLESPLFAQRITSIIVEAQLAAHHRIHGTADSGVSTLYGFPHPPDNAFGFVALSSHDDISDSVVIRPDSANILPIEHTLPETPTTSMTTAPASIPSSDDHASASMEGISDELRWCNLSLVNGVSLTFHQGEVPPMEPFCFSADIQRLISSWDDTSSEWNPQMDHPIKIHGQPIPVKHWRKLYSYNKSVGNEWEQLKKEWSHWHYFMERYYLLGSADFWTRYSNPRGCMSYTQISQSLLKECKQANERLKKQAHTEYRDAFDTEFGYTKSKNKCTEWMVLTKASSIAKLYRKKKGLAATYSDDEEDED